MFHYGNYMANPFVVAIQSLGLATAAEAATRGMQYEFTLDRLDLPQRLTTDTRPFDYLI